jgi:flagellar biosynthesis anti-sigma factor FlgM
MGKTVRNISSHSLFSTAGRTDRNEEAETGEADTEVEKATIRSINSKRPDSTMQPDDINELMQDIPAVDREKINNIKARINDGSFRINTRSIVEKLLQTEDLLK